MGFKMVLTAVFVLSASANILIIGKERKPLSEELVLLDVLIDAVLVYGVWSWL